MNAKPRQLRPSSLAVRLPIASIRPNPNQPRRVLTGVEELAHSIRKTGLLEPIMVRRTNVADHYEIILGHRRWLACSAAGLTYIDAIIREAGDTEAFEIALVENLQRVDLSPIEEAEAYRTLQQLGITQAAIGSMVGKGQSYIAQKLRLLRLPLALQHFLLHRALSENHIRQLLRLRDVYTPDLQRSLGIPSLGPYAESHAVDVLICLKPEQKPSLGLSPPRPLPPVIVEACRLFLEYVSQHSGAVPQWEAAAFWWAGMAVSCQLSVAELTRHLDHWRERYEHALAWWAVFGGSGELPSAHTKDVSVWWGFYADLRHSGSLARPAQMEADESGARILLKRWEEQRERGFVLPSELQRPA